MTDLERLAELAMRVEGLTGADREVDAEIAAALRIGTEHAWALNYPAWVGRGDGRVYLEEGGPSFAAPTYTASIDSAMTLVPEGWTFANLSQSDRKGWWCELRQGFLTSYDKTASGNQLENSSPALALCAAALRALAAKSREVG